MFKSDINMYVVYDKLNLIASFNLGNKEKVQSFFVNIARYLENNNWGSVYPVIMNEFYNGKLESNHVNYAISEIRDIKKKLGEIEVEISFLNDEKVPMSLDEVFVNDKRAKMTDKILNVLESVRNKKASLYIGDYYQREMFKIIEKNKKRQILDNIIKYIVYLLIVIIVKFAVSKQQFNEFIIKFIFFMFVAELMVLNSKLKIKSIRKEKRKSKRIK